MQWLLLAVGGLILCFGFVVFFGAPYLPTLTKQVESALDLAGLQPGQTLLELGCGDGKVLIAAADRGWQAIGYELNPILALVAWLRTRRFQGRVKVVCADFWRRPWPPADGIFVFLLDKYMLRLDERISMTASRPVVLVSFAFQIPDKQPAAVHDGVYVYRYSQR